MDPRPAPGPFLMQWTTPAVSIAMCQNAVDVAEPFESGCGYKPKSGPCPGYVCLYEALAVKVVLVCVA